MEIAVVGTGYVGLTLGSCFAERGHRVTCVDRDAARIESLSLARLPLFEPGLAELVSANVKRRRLSFTTDLRAAASRAAAVFVAVGTPPGADGSADLNELRSAVVEIAAAIKPHAVVVIKSTVPPTTTSAMAELVRETTQTPFSIAFNPEFLREGRAVADSMRPDRVVIGTDDERARLLLSELYARVVPTERLFFTDAASAELSKYAANVLLATRIGLVNEIAELAEKVGADISAVCKTAGADHRIGEHFLEAGPGFGGSCFPKDILALASCGASHGVAMPIAAATAESNRRQKLRIARQLARELGGRIADRRIAVWGLAFKAGTDDVRESPALTVAAALRDAGAVVVCADPVAHRSARGALDRQIRVTDCHLSAARRADAIVVMTEWPQFAAVDYSALAKTMRGRLIFDTRRIIGTAAEDAGFRVRRLGIGQSEARASELEGADVAV